MSDYRDAANEVRREAWWTLRKFIALVVVLLCVVVVLGWGLKRAGIIGMNIDRNVVQQSQQYVESKQAKLQTLYSEYMDLEVRRTEASLAKATELEAALKAQKGALLAQMRREVTNIPSSEVPEEVANLLAVMPR